MNTELLLHRPWLKAANWLSVSEKIREGRSVFCCCWFDKSFLVFEWRRINISAKNTETNSNCLIVFWVNFYEVLCRKLIFLVKFSVITLVRLKYQFVWYDYAASCLHTWNILMTAYNRWYLLYTNLKALWNTFVPVW